MNGESKNAFQWPEPPPLPRRGVPVLLRVPVPAERMEAQVALRSALRTVLAGWSNQLADALPLRETAHGPEWVGLLGGETLALSLAYTGAEGWLGLRRGGAMGVDAMMVEPFAEMTAVARTYFDPDTVAKLVKSRQPELDFAVAWTTLEARLKCLKRPLAEWSDASAVTLNMCAVQTSYCDPKLIISIATS